ncbi:RHS repeat-associated core domain-containing protein [Andreprevotia chitinilytica]
MDGNGFQTTFTYDANGNRLTKTDAFGHVTKYAYDALNRLSQQTNPAGDVTTFSYDANNHLVSVTDPKGFTTSYTYDGFDNLLKLVSPDSGTTNYVNDAAGNTTQKTDARGKTTQYQYDSQNRIININYGDQTQTFSYDTAANGVGKLGSFTDADGSTSYSYDAQGHTTQVSRTANVGGNALTQTVGYSWLSGNRIQTITYPSGLTVTYGWNKATLTSVTVNGQPLASNIVWSASIGAQGWSWANGQTWARAADNIGRIAGLKLGDAIRVNSYDNVGNVSTISDTAYSTLNQNFRYDVLDQLLVGNVDGVTFYYGYDKNGNRDYASNGRSATYFQYDPASNKLLNTTGNNGATYQYDAVGNQTQAGNMISTYNNADRLSQVQVGSAITLYSYNALGQRVQKTNANGTIRFVYDEAGHLLGEYDATGKAIQEMVWLGDLPIAAVRPTADPANPKIYYVWADQLGTPRQVTDPVSNAVVWRWDGEAFGNSLPNQDPANTGTSFIYNLRFPGQYYDAETGHNYNLNRDYDPQNGRYLTSDPLGLAGGSFSTYAYVGNRPTGTVDPSGLFSVSPATLEKAAERAVAAEVVGLGPEDPAADVAAIAAIATTIMMSSDSTGQSASTKNCPPNNDKCKDLQQRIRDIAGKLRSKLVQLNKDPYNLFVRAHSVNPGGDLEGKGTYMGHVTQINGLKKGLADKIKEARDLGCEIPSDLLQLLE